MGTFAVVFRATLDPGRQHVAVKARRRRSLVQCGRQSLHEAAGSRQHGVGQYWQPAWGVAEGMQNMALAFCMPQLVLVCMLPQGCIQPPAIACRCLSWSQE